MKGVNKTDFYIIGSEHPFYPELEKIAEEDKK